MPGGAPSWGAGSRPSTPYACPSFFGATASRHLFLFHPHDHRIGPAQMLDARLPEAGLAHPGGAVCARVIEPAARLDQHVQAHQQPEGVAPALVVDERLEDDE